MNYKNNVLVVNSSFPEMNHIAFGLLERKLLSRYIRPYVNQGRTFEKALANLLPDKIYRNTFGRRILPYTFPAGTLKEVALLQDFLFALTPYFPKAGKLDLQRFFTELRTRTIAKKILACLHNERCVIASWGAAELIFQEMHARNGLCVLNYPLAHHTFTEKFLNEEAELVPEFADTLNSHNRPGWLSNRLDKEIKLADRILAGSSFVKKSFVEQGIAKEKIVVIPYGADVSRFYPARDKADQKNNGLNALFVGQIGQRKGIYYLLRAWEKFHGPQSSLTLVGRIQGNGRAFIPFRHLFMHVNHVPNAQLPLHYQNADVFLFPTLVEGMPIVVLEAMASGLPVITTPNGPGDIVRDGVDGYIVPTRDVDAIVDRLELLRSDKELRQWMGQNARKRALEFTWDVYRNRTTNHICSWLHRI